MSHSLRSTTNTQKYLDYRKDHTNTCALCEKPSIKTFTHWKLMANDFPYDLIAETHHMIVPIRHVTEEGLLPEEWHEYQQIKNTDLQEYDYLAEGTHKLKSIPEHFHIHLLTIKYLSDA